MDLLWNPQTQELGLGKKGGERDSDSRLSCGSVVALRGMTWSQPCNRGGPQSSGTPPSNHNLCKVGVFGGQPRHSPYGLSILKDLFFCFVKTKTNVLK